MKKTLLFASLSSLLITGYVSAQTTFTFTPAHTTGDGGSQIFQQTVDGITCTASYEPENSAMTIDELTENAGLINNQGLWMGVHIRQTDPNRRTPFSRPGARITFSHDVRLKSYTLGRDPHFNEITYCYLRGGNVTALAHYDDGTNYTGERPFELECVVPAGTPLLTCANDANFTPEWRFSSLTVEPETYVEPNLPIPEGNETGVTRIALVSQSSNYKFAYALKNGRLHQWSPHKGRALSRDFIFDGAESGVLDFTATTSTSDRNVLIETVEGFVLFLFESARRFYIIPLDGTLPADPDQIFISDAKDGAFVMALKDGEIYFDGPARAVMEATMPTELADGGVSEIASGDHAAMAVKNGRFYVWGGDINGLSVRGASIPEAVTNGEILHLAAYALDAVVQLTSGELITFGQGGGRSLSTDQTSGEIFADLRFEEEHIIALRDDGSFLVEDKRGSSAGGRVKAGYEGPFYELDPENPDATNDFLLRGLEIPPSIVQQLGYEQITFGHENAGAILPGGRMIIWGGVDIAKTGRGAIHPIQADAVPAQINEILFPQTNVARLAQSAAPDAAELSMLEAGGLGIRWGSNTVYEIETTTDLVGGEWTPLPTDANQRIYRIRERTP